jgi:hypothetical protein
MSLLGNLLGNLFESYVVKEFAIYKNFIEQMVAQENAVLRSFGIKPPRCISAVSYNEKPPRDGKPVIELIPPQFEFPPYLQFTIKENQFGIKENQFVATIFNDIKKAEGNYLLWGLGFAIEQQEDDFIWTNRNPFRRYLELQKKPSEYITFYMPGILAELAQPKQGDYEDKIIHYWAEYQQPLEAVKGLSNEEAGNVHLRVQLYNFVTGGESQWLRHPRTYYTYPDNGDAATAIADNLLFKLPVVPAQPKSLYAGFKILPSSDIKPARMIEFLNSLHSLNQLFSFELMRKDETAYFQFWFPSEYADAVQQKLNLYFPDFELMSGETFPAPPYFINWLKKYSAYHPINRLRDYQIDPYAHFASFFENAAPEDPLCYQILFAPLHDKAAEIIKRHLAERTFLPNYTESFAKILPAWLVNVTISSTNEQTMAALMQGVPAAFNSGDNFSRVCSSILSDTELPPPFFLTNYSLFNTEELALVAHFPISPLPLERLERLSMKNVQPPELYQTGSVQIGESRARGQMQPVMLPESVRDRHLYIVGKSGTGKSTVMETIALHDIQNGGGVAIIDPHGDMIQHLLEVMPEHRVADCVLFSPKHCPISLEILAAENEHEIDLLSDDLITMFRRTSESWGDKMQAILQMAFQTLLRVPGSSFTDITPFLTDENYRRRLLAKINHPQLESFWEQRYDVRQAEPILIRMDRLTTSGTMRRVLTQTEKSLNFYDVITESKIFLADLSKGFLGESTSHLLGSIIVSQIQLAAMRQAQLPMEQRIPFSLFVDEVQNFTTSAFSTILSEARKQKLRLTIAHQFVSQLPAEIQKAVFGNVGTMLFFALSPDDLGAARHELGTFEPADVANLPKYHALCRPVTAARDTFSMTTFAPPAAPEKNFAALIIEQTQRQYGEPTAAAGNQPTSPLVSTEPSPHHQPPQNLPPDAALPPAVRHRPAPARPLTFATNTEKIMYFLRCAEYLSQPQIIALTGLQASNASTALKKLVETGQIKSLDERRPKIYFIGRGCNPTTHNLLVRDLFVKIYASNFAVRAVKFNDNLSEINPDLTVEFIRDDGSPLFAYFELDRGTEGAAELVRKADRYAKISSDSPVGFIFEREPDMQLARKSIPYQFIYYATLDQFSSLEDASFYAGDALTAAPPANIKLPFFGS